jgi:hypothetical protein
VVLNSGGNINNNKKRKEKKKKNNVPKILATFVYASSQGQRTHYARTNLKCHLGSQRTSFSPTDSTVQFLTLVCFSPHILRMWCDKQHLKEHVNLVID